MKAALLLVCALVAACTPMGASSRAESTAFLNDCRPGVHQGTFRGQPVRIDVPQRNSDGSRPPAVMVLHGVGDTGRHVAVQTRFEALGREQGFITVFPSAPQGQWSLTTQGASDINSLAAALSCADSRRIYLAGFSRGSAMAFQVACTATPRRFAAFGGVAFPDYMSQCNSAPPTPWIYFHGLQDSTVSYGGYRLSTGRTTPGAQVAMKKWARHNRCRTGPSPAAIGSDVILRRYGSCRANAAVRFYTITDGDHQWPFHSRPNAPLLKSGQSWASVGATKSMWRFFSVRSLPAHVSQSIPTATAAG